MGIKDRGERANELKEARLAGFAIWQREPSLTSRELVGKLKEKGFTVERNVARAWLSRWRKGGMPSGMSRQKLSETRETFFKKMEVRVIEIAEERNELVRLYSEARREVGELHLKIDDLMMERQRRMDEIVGLMRQGDKMATEVVSPLIKSLMKLHLDIMQVLLSTLPK